MSLAYYYALLQKKQNDLQRLRTCNYSLLNKQAEFTNKKYLMTEPELTEDTWYGTLASDFDTIRIEGILASYTEIEDTQFNNVFSELNRKIQEIIAEIEAIKQTIARLEAEAARQAASSRATK